MFNRRMFLATAGATLLGSASSAFTQTTPGKVLRIVVVANRNHEADGLMAALSNQMKHSPNLSYPYKVTWPTVAMVTGPHENTTTPRCLVDVYRDPTADPKVLSPEATVEIWCIDDLATVHGDSGLKVTAMETIKNYGPPPDAVIAFGTAGYPDLASNNGSATIGGTIFIHNAAKDIPGSQGGTWEWSGFMKTLVPSKVPASFFSTVAADQKTLTAISQEMIAPQDYAAKLLQLIIAPDAVGISSVNIPSITGAGAGQAYCQVDSTAVKEAQGMGATNITSVETTHGVIRSKWPDAPFIYVTAIPNRICHFPDEAQGNYAQEFPSSHNAGVALKYVLPYLVSAITP